MEQTRNFNLVAAGIVKHGEKKVSGNKQSVVDYGYFIAKEMCIRDRSFTTHFHQLLLYIFLIY